MTHNVQLMNNLFQLFGDIKNQTSMMVCRLGIEPNSLLLEMILSMSI